MQPPIDRAPGCQMPRAGRLLQCQSHVLEDRGEVGIIVHRQALSRPFNFLRRVQALLDGQARADWWRPWQRYIMAHVLVIRCTAGKEVA